MSGENCLTSSLPGSLVLLEVQGINPCREAHLAVVDDRSRLCDCPDPSSLPHAGGIIGRCVPVITGSSWVLAKGHLVLVPKESVVRYQPLVAGQKVVFEYKLIMSRVVFEAIQRNLEGSGFFRFGRWRKRVRGCEITSQRLRGDSAVLDMPCNFLN